MAASLTNNDPDSAEHDEVLISHFGLGAEGADNERWLQLVREAANAAPLRRLGRFELLSEVSRGGQGIIYRAREIDTGNIVAVKRLIGGALASPTSQLRLERELEAVAHLKHSGIVEALGFEYVEGQPILSMKWIDGISITQWAKFGTSGQRRSPRETVAMLRKVCQALQHAHQRGVIHRDLKPSNILVDANDQPHILDFGLAKLTLEEGQRAAAPALTISEQFIGTLRYASPEQLSGRVTEIDVRSDVFSLGVIAYQMLTGRTPYPQSESPRQALEMIDSTRVPRLSTLRAQIDRDLELIILKAFEREPQHRFQSVDALDADLDRWESGAPIVARGQSTAYVLRKLVRRHKIRFAFGSIVAILIIGGGILAAVLAARLESARQHEHSARVTAEKISAFLNDVIAASDPVANPDTEVTARQLLDRAAERLKQSGELAGEPSVKAALHQTIGVSYMNLGLMDAADQQLNQALALRRGTAVGDAAALAENESWLATLRYQQRRFPEAEQFSRSALQMKRSLYGDQNADVATELNNLAAIIRSQGDLDHAEELLNESLHIRRTLLGEDHPDVAETLNNLANIYRIRGDLTTAEKMCREVLESRRRHYGEPHALVAQSMANLGVIIGSQGRIDECQKLMSAALEMERGLLGPDHPSVGTISASLGQILVKAHRYSAAEPLLRDAIRIREQTSPNDLLTPVLRLHRGSALFELNQLDEAESLLVTAYHQLSQAASPDDHLIRTALELLIDINRKQGNSQAVEQYRDLLKSVAEHESKR